MNNENKLNLLASELYTANSYIDRVFHAIINVSGLKQLPSNRKLCASLSHEVTELLKENILHPRLTGPSIHTEVPAELPPEKLKIEIKGITNIFNTIISLGRDPDQTIHSTVTYINLLYKYSYKLHGNCKKQAGIEVTYPRLNSARMEYEEEEPTHDSLPLFTLSRELFENLNNNKLISITALDFQREKKYEELLQNGHQAIFEKKPEKALEKFKKACNYKETSEILNLIGWSFSLIGDLQKAKSYCLKAIKKDPNYGPPYNDLGSYIMGEGNYVESLKWFKLAKNAPNYTNREYPYINSGRVFLNQGKYEDAIEEFQQALSIAPFQEELEQTINDLKLKLAKKESRRENNFPTTL